MRCDFFSDIIIVQVTSSIRVESLVFSAFYRLIWFNLKSFDRKSLHRILVKAPVKVPEIYFSFLFCFFLNI